MLMLDSVREAWMLTQTLLGRCCFQWGLTVLLVVRCFHVLAKCVLHCDLVFVFCS
jgi:hypothetical protein